MEIKRKRHPPIAENPKLMGEWDFSKNTNLDPNKTTQGSPQKAFWKCSAGHEWLARINSRLVSDCPTCVGKGVLRPENTLWSRKDVRKYWDNNKSQAIDPKSISQTTSVQIWCLCPDCGEEWEQKAYQKVECKQCIKKNLSENSSLAVLYPEVSSEWDIAKNISMTPQTIFGRSKKKVWWKCQKGHSYQSSIRQRTVDHTGCAICIGRKFDGINSFATQYPDLLKEWDFQKNLDINPELLLPQSNKKVHWICNKGHHWMMGIHYRISDSDAGCPYCSLSSANEENNLAVTHPNLAKEWDYEKNLGLDIFKVTAIKNIRANWRCHKDHTWSAIIATRANGAQCPYCAGKLASEDSNLATEFPLIAQQWHPMKNNGKKPTEFRPMSSAKAWWKCNRGHEWQTAISSRTSSLTGCPICKPSTSKVEIRAYAELKSLFSDTEWRTKFQGKEIDVYIPSLKLAIEIDGYIWHLDKTLGDQKKDKFFTDHGLFVARLRDEKLPTLGLNEFKFNSSVLDTLSWFNFIGWLAEQIPFKGKNKKVLSDYANNKVLIGEDLYKAILSKLPSPLFEKSLAVINPTLSNEWDYEKNGAFTPDMFTPGSNEKIWWLCKLNHSWQAIIASRATGRGCPFCGKGPGSRRRSSTDHNLALENPNLAKEWDFNKNDLTPKDVTPNSGIKVWWKCQKGHEWQAIISSRNRGRGCPYCKGNKVSADNSLQTSNPILAREWHPKNTLSPKEVLQRSNYKAWWKCSACNHEWEARVYSRSQGRGCIKCSYRNGRKKKVITTVT